MGNATVLVYHTKYFNYMFCFNTRQWIKFDVNDNQDIKNKAMLCHNHLISLNSINDAVNLLNTIDKNIDSNHGISYNVYVLTLRY